MKVFLMLISSILFIGYSFSQESILTLEEAIRISLNNNVNLKTERNNLINTQMQNLVSKASFGPTVSANFMVGQTNGNQFIQQTAEVINGTATNAIGGLNGNLVLFNGFSTLNNYKSANNFLEAQEYNVKQTEQNLIAQVVGQYLQTFLNIQLLEIAEENLNFQRKNLNQVQIQVKIGSLPYVDEANQIALMKTAELAHLRAKVNLRNSSASLALLLLVDPSAELTLQEPNIDRIILDIPPLEELLQTAKENRSDLKALQANEIGSEFRMKSQFSSMTPTILAFGGWNSRFTDNSVRSFQDQFFTDWRSISYGLSINVPIFNGFGNKLSYVSSKVQYENSTLRRINQEKIIQSEILTAYQNYIDAIQTNEMAISQIEAAQAAYDLNKDSFELGLIDVITFAQANRDYFNARSSLLNARVSLYFQDLLLKSATGTISSEDFK